MDIDDPKFQKYFKKFIKDRVYIVKYFDKIKNEWIEKEMEGNYKDMKMFQLFNKNNISDFSYLIKKVTSKLTKKEDKNNGNK